ncbi:Deleted in lung and esophageal cancer protein 1, partial [Rhizophlyctis rosea]
MIRLACDNTQVLKLPLLGIAQKPQIKITRIQFDDGSIIHHEGFQRDEVFDLVLPFGPQNPKAMSTCLFTVKNETLLRLPFKWITFDNPGTSASTTPPATINHPPESLLIDPPTGHLPPSTETIFEIRFTPQLIKIYDLLSRLSLLPDRPQSPSLRSPSPTPTITPITIRSTGHGIPYDLTVRPTLLAVPKTLSTGKPYTTTLTLTNHSVSRVAYDWALSNIDSRILDVSLSSTSGTIEPNSSISLELELVGGFPGRLEGALMCYTAHDLGPVLRVPVDAVVELVEGSIGFVEEIVDFGLIRLGGAKRCKVGLRSDAGLPVRWEVGWAKRGKEGGKDVKDGFVVCEPSEGILNPGERTDIVVEFIPLWYQSFRGILDCRISYLQPPTTVSSRSATPDSKITDLTNNELDETDPPIPSILAAAIELRAEVQTPSVRLLNPTNYVQAYITVPFKYTLTLQNNTLLPAEFKFLPIKMPGVQVTFTPETGTIPGGQDIDIRVQVLLTRLSDEDIHIPLNCHIEGMVPKNGLITADLQISVKAIDVTFRILSTTPDGTRTVTSPKTRISSASAPNGPKQRFDFGNECPIFANVTRTLVVRNLSAVEAPWRVWVEKFAATALEEEEDGDGAGAGAGVEVGGGRLKKSTSRASDLSGNILSENVSDDNPPLLPPTTVAKIGFTSQAGQEYINNIKGVRKLIQKMHLLLREGKGAAFHATPSHGTIPPWSEIHISLTSYNNLVGIFEDTFVCEIGEWIREIIPIRLGVVGLPVKFSGAQLVASRKDSPGGMDRVNFGTRILLPKPSPSLTIPQTPNHEPHSKVIHLENQTPRDILLQWKIFLHHVPISTSSSSTTTSTSRTPPTPPDLHTWLLPSTRRPPVPSPAVSPPPRIHLPPPPRPLPPGT